MDLYSVNSNGIFLSDKFMGDVFGPKIALGADRIFAGSFSLVALND